MAITCPNCHFAGNPDTAERCSLCNIPFRQASRNESQIRNDSNQDESTLLPGDYRQTQPRCSTHEDSAPSTEITLQNHLIGRVTWFEQTAESINFNWCKFLSQLLLFLILMPLFLVIFTISLILWLMLAILGFRNIAQSISPFNIVNTINSFGTLVAIAFPRISQCNQTPAFRITVRSSDRERPALIKGELVSGTFRRGDEIEFQGKWRNGTLFVQRGFNRTLNSRITLRKDYWYIVLIGLLIFVVATVSFILMKYSEVVTK